VSTNDETAIREVTAHLAAAWSAGDATGYGALFTEDADYVVFNGVHLKGRQAIVDTHRWLFDGPLKDTRIAGSTADGPVSFRFVRPDVAIMVSTGGMVPPGEASPAEGAVQTTVFVKNNGEWQLASFQNTRKSA
jgi:uncharacterized protein (TIGR02246 family)